MVELMNIQKGLWCKPVTSNLSPLASMTLRYVYQVENRLLYVLSKHKYVIKEITCTRAALKQCPLTLCLSSHHQYCQSIQQMSNIVKVEHIHASNLKAE